MMETVHGFTEKEKIEVENKNQAIPQR